VRLSTIVLGATFAVALLAVTAPNPPLLTFVAIGGAFVGLWLREEGR
jgi:hypothetical protein